MTHGPKDNGNGLSRVRTNGSHLGHHPLPSGENQGITDPRLQKALIESVLGFQRCVLGGHLKHLDPVTELVKEFILSDEHLKPAFLSRNLPKVRLDDQRRGVGDNTDASHGQGTGYDRKFILLASKRNLRTRGAGIGNIALAIDVAKDLELFKPGDLIDNRLTAISKELQKLASESKQAMEAAQPKLVARGIIDGLIPCNFIAPGKVVIDLQSKVIRFGEQAIPLKPGKTPDPELASLGEFAIRNRTPGLDRKILQLTEVKLLENKYADKWVALAEEAQALLLICIQESAKRACEVIPPEFLLLFPSESR